MKMIFASFTAIMLSAQVSYAQWWPFEPPRPRTMYPLPSAPKKPAPAKPAPKPVAKPAPKPTVPAKPALSPKEQLYQLAGVQTLWTDGAAATPAAFALKAMLQRANEEGLNANDYWTANLEAQLNGVTAESADRFEAALTDVLLRYSADLSNGRLNPEAISEDVKFKRKALDVAAVVNALKSVVPDYSAAFAANVAPQWPQYKNLKAAMNRLSALDMNEAWPEIAVPKADPKLNDKGQVFANVKIRLQTLGYQVTELQPVYTKELAALVKTYVADHALKGAADLKRSSPFWGQISVPLAARVQQIRLTLEKIRWMNNPEARYVFVNLAFQRLSVVENGQSVLSMRTINGRFERKSPSMRDRIVDVELNPDWTVPNRLIAEDKAPAVMADPSFLSRGNYRVYGNDGEELDPSWVDWGSITKENAGQITIKQAPGLGNALGVMKFNLTNPYAIYLHDTNERYLFPNSHRLLSSGCVRLERPFDLATYLLRDHPQWNDPRKIQENVANTAVLDGWSGIKAKNHIRLVNAVPVYLMDLTAEVDGGLLKLTADYYAQDQDLFNALKK